MASRRFEKGSEEWEMFSSFWKICQRLWDPEDNDEYWEQVVNATDDFYNKYKANNEIFSKKITLALVGTLEERLKQKKDKRNIEVDKMAVMEAMKAR